MILNVRLEMTIETTKPISKLMLFQEFKKWIYYFAEINYDTELLEEQRLFVNSFESKQKIVSPFLTLEDQYAKKFKENWEDGRTWIANERREDRNWYQLKQKTSSLHSEPNSTKDKSNLDNCN